MSGPVLPNPRLEMSMTTQEKHNSKCTYSVEYYTEQQNMREECETRVALGTPEHYPRAYVA